MESLLRVMGSLLPFQSGGAPSTVEDTREESLPPLVSLKSLKVVGLCVGAVLAGERLLSTDDMFAMQTPLLVTPGHG